ncbi:hypothetical protein [Rhodoferax saidenbachensis]|uniref:Uncharacterized protein n=1 Tax=Rhodoferax saidenbachensis TaxID=1484693 RepID=A0A1P8KAI6_9BURK|nr:hypothetical protein [Rhodoferax saidenbachensis]APW42985.1 hypothetical protein RS694_10875 [Rhodoferax saidenbachensis]
MSAPQLTPVERLALSRERLRVAIAHNAAARASGATAPGAGLIDILKTAVPGAGLLIDTLGPTFKQWWARHPLQSSSAMTSDVVRTVLRPVAQRHPVALMAGAVVLGAVLIWSRPWRWAFRPRNLFATIGPTLVSSVLASAAVQSWIASVLAQEKDSAQAQNQEPPVSE